jgi:GDP-L-fucose synthase
VLYESNAKVGVGMGNWESKRVLVTGGNGFLGTVLVSQLRSKGCKDIVIPRSRTDDLRVRENCDRVVHDRDIVFHLAANVGGIGYNQENPGDLFYDNIMMGVQMVEAARRAGVEKFIAVGTICSYPCFAPIPFKEENIWDGYPESTNAPYGLAKKMLLVQSQAYRKQYNFNSVVVFPTNLYGPGDNFDPKSSHVIPALIRKIDEANQRKEARINVWGDGSPTREFVYVDDAARALVLAGESYNRSDPINIGSGEEISIRDLVNILVKIMGFSGRIEWDSGRPNGQPRRKVDSSKALAEFGFKAEIPLAIGLKKTVDWYYSHHSEASLPSKDEKGSREARERRSITTAAGMSIA